MMKFAAQMHMLRAYCTCQTDMLDTFTRLKEMGFDGVELEFYLLKNGDREAVASHLDNIGLEVCSIRSPFARTEFGLEDMIAQAKALKCRHVGIGTIKVSHFNQGSAGLDKYCDQVSALCETFSREGLIPLYSLRNHEFMQRGDSWIYDRIRKIPGLEFETDVLHLTRAAVDPPRIFNQLSGSMPVCRLTDQKIRENEMYFFFPEREECPLGEGLFDLPLWTQAAANAGAAWFVLGQDLCDRDPWECLRISLEYAKGNLL